MSDADLTIYRNQVIVNDYLSKMRGELIDETDRLRAENAALKRHNRNIAHLLNTKMNEPEVLENHDCRM
jgi:hypothetical protein